MISNCINTNSCNLREQNRMVIYFTNHQATQILKISFAYFRYKEQKSEVKKQEQLKKEKEAKKKAKEEFKKNKLQELREKGLISPSSDWTIDSDTGEPLRKAQK